MQTRLPKFLLCLLTGTALALALGACTATPQARIASGAEGRAEEVPDALLRAADAAMDRRDYATAASLYRQAHQMRRERIAALIGLGHALSGAGPPRSGGGLPAGAEAGAAQPGGPAQPGQCDGRPEPAGARPALLP